MKTLSIVFTMFMVSFYSFAQVSPTQSWVVDTMAAMPERVSNNAVVAGEMNGTTYIYSFAGIDSTRNYPGIHLRSYRYNTQTNVWSPIDPLPDTLGKIAAIASTVKNKI